MAYTFEQTKRGYASLWDKASIRPEFLASAQTIAQRILDNKDVLLTVQQATRVPWWMVGVMLYRESNLDFKTYLGNGQSLAHVTTEVPAGRGPFKTFLAGAIDAIDLEGMNGISRWTIELVLYWLERFNGEGYFGVGINDPYLWAWTTLYLAGKFVADHKFNASFKDPQAGCVAILIVLFQLDPSSMPQRETLQSAPSPTIATHIPATQTTVKPMTTTAPAPANPDVLGEIESALATAQNELPTIIGFLSTFIPQLKVVQPFLSLLPIAIQAVHTIHSVTGSSTPIATQQVAAHLTPGLPDAPALGTGA